MNRLSVRIILGLFFLLVISLFLLHNLGHSFQNGISSPILLVCFASIFLVLGFLSATIISSYVDREKLAFSSRAELRKAVQERERAEALLQILFDELPRSTPLHSLLNKLLATIEKFSPEMQTSIMLLNKERDRIETGISPSLPKPYIKSLEGIKIGPRAGSCGTSAFKGKLVVVTDIHTDPLWKDYKYLTMNYGLRACWSQPIYSPEGDVLGTFAIYYKKVHKPKDRDLRLIFFAAYLVRLAIQYQKFEEGRSKSESKYRDLVENASDGIFVANTDGKLLEINPSGSKMLGYSREELLTLNIKDLIQPEDLAATPLRGFNLQDRKSMILERKLIRKDKKPISVEISARYLDSGHLQGIVRDISERTAAERTLRQAQKMESIGLLAGGIAHDFNNLLTMILGTADVIRQICKSDPALKKHANRIIEASERGKAITRQLLLFASPGSTEMKPISIAPLLKEVTDMMRFSLPKNIHLETDFHSLNGIILGDSGHLHQAVLNLILNAKDAMPGGGNVYVRGGIISGRILRSRFPGANADNYIEIDITDTGIGMKAENKERIFEPFFTTKGNSGTGLGLSIVRGIITEHSGFIEVESELEKGTKFSLFFPAIRTAVDAIRKEEDNSKKINLNILIVDDEELVLEVLQEILTLAGSNVWTRKTGEGALAFYKEAPEKFDVIITDLGMPGMGGETLIDLLLQFNPKVNIIITSGNLEKEKKEILRMKGIKAFLDKPYKASEVYSALLEILKSDSLSG
ncbi:hybrid sensor histidine kinase/response regulator [Leptospira fainei]|nr:ATP-binding protein [Leptospira fainei]